MLGWCLNMFHKNKEKSDEEIVKEETDNEEIEIDE
jgi:hypothetical protein